VRRLDAAFPLGLYALGTLRRRQAAALQGAARIFMQGGESQDREVCARNDRVGFPTPNGVHWDLASRLGVGFVVNLD
jgi:hypothetical protein